MPRFRRTSPLLLFLLLGLSVPAAAAERHRSSLEVIAAQLWQQLTAPLAVIWAKSGGAMDPDGKPLPPPPPTAQGDSGGAMDPDGWLKP